MKRLYFNCENAGLTFWFKDKDILNNDKENWNIKINKEDIDVLISKLEDLKFIINYEQSKTS